MLISEISLEKWKRKIGY